MQVSDWPALYVIQRLAGLYNPKTNNIMLWKIYLLFWEKKKLLFFFQITKIILQDTILVKTDNL